MTMSDLKIAPRSEWTGTKPKRTTLSWDAVKYVVIHWPGTPGKKISTNIRELLRGWYTYHAKDRGWTDIAYNYAVDQTGKIWTLRGDYRDGATSGWGGRSVSILAVLANSETPSEDMLKSLKALAETLRGRAAKGAKIVGHKSLVSTSCPGAKISTWISKGMPVKKTVINSGKFQHGTFNMQEAAHGGLPNRSAQRSNFLYSVVKASVYCLQECPEVMRDTLKKRYSKWLTYATASVCVMWNRDKWQYDNKGIGDVKWSPYHGAIRVPLTNIATGLQVDIISIHVPPAAHWSGKSRDYIRAEKRELIREACARLIRPGYATVFAGDFNLENVDDILASFGLTLCGAVDKSGYLIDRVYVSEKATGVPTVIPNPTSDHNGLKTHVTIRR